MTLTDRLWDQVKDVLYVTKEDWLKSIEGWTITPHMADNELVGAVLVKDDVLHFTTFGRVRITREDVRHYLQPLIDAHGRARTNTPKEMTRQHAFNRALGFVQTGEDEYDIHYQIDEETFRRKICRL